MTTGRRLIVNADDLGRSAGINQGVLRAHAEGIVTSASLMVRYAAAADAGDAARDRPGLGLGLHFDLAEWEYRDGDWHCLYEVVPSDDRVAVEHELARQLHRFVALTGRLPTHIDSHQHVHRDEPVRSVVVAAGRALGIPVRHMPPVRYCGAFYGQGRYGEPLPGAVSAGALARLIGDLEEGMTEVVCHPAASIDIETAYADERLAELEALCDPAVRDAVADRGLELCSFGDLPLVASAL